jgi:hypothetical protein
VHHGGRRFQIEQGARIGGVVAAGFRQRNRGVALAGLRGVELG